jgi:hypothetical protein
MSPLVLNWDFIVADRVDKARAVPPYGLGYKLKLVISAREACITSLKYIVTSRLVLSYKKAINSGLLVSGTTSCDKRTAPPSKKFPAISVTLFPSTTMKVLAKVVPILGIFFRAMKSK